MTAPNAKSQETQITREPAGHVLTHVNAWSPDSCWLVYDKRSDAAGSVFDSPIIERVHVATGEVQSLFRAVNRAHCGVVTCNPVDDRVAFIQGPERPTPDWSYSAYHRHGVSVNVARPHVGQTLDARDLTPPFTPGALRGGTHVHVFSGDGQWLSFTYEDHVLATQDHQHTQAEPNQRNVGVSAPAGSVVVPSDHPRNHHGAMFSVLVTRTTSSPAPGSDEISRAYEDAWVGSHGYRKHDGSRQKRALAFQGDVVTRDHQTISEVFIVDIPDDITTPGDGPLQGTATTMPRPPRGTVQRRLTHTADRKHPGIQGPRHWLRSSPDGEHIAFLMKDDAGVVQLWTISPRGGPPAQLTRNVCDIASAFTWSPCGRWIAHAMDNSIFATQLATGRSVRLTPRTDDASAPRPEACVFSPDGSMIAFVRTLPHEHDKTFNQICVVRVGKNLR
ncbi:MAG: DUF3748 domain-containing protein [Phycisphaeraceae bacterium]